MSGAEMIADERQRQVQQEGWTPEHDDEHDEGEMAISAAAYALRHTHKKPIAVDLECEGSCFPLKPKDPIRNLVRAGALIAAAIDRIQRTLGIQ
jgi:hypothetical protein